MAAMSLRMPFPMWWMWFQAIRMRRVGVGAYPQRQPEAIPAADRTFFPENRHRSGPGKYSAQRGGVFRGKRTLFRRNSHIVADNLPFKGVKQVRAGRRQKQKTASLIGTGHCHNRLPSLPDGVPIYPDPARGNCKVFSQKFFISIENGDRVL